MDNNENINKQEIEETKTSENVEVSATAVEVSEQPKKKSVKKNYFYNLIYQIFLLIAPVIVTPYISRVLTSEGVGQYSFSYSIVYYFTLLAALGFNYYAQKEIAKYQNDKEKQTKIFWEITIVKSVSVAISAIIYLSIIWIPYFSTYNTLLLILVLNVFAILLDSAFMFQGNEDFKQITIRNVIVKTIVIAAIFIFVREKADLWKYTLINAMSPMLSALIMFPFLRHYLIKVSIKSLRPLQHVVPTLKLFVPTIAISVYAMLDKTMIGFLIPGEITVVENGVVVIKKVSDIENGCYEQSEKIVKLVLTILTSLGTVMVPRNSAAYKKGELDIVKNNIYHSFHFVFLLAIPMLLGIVCIATNFCPWFFGDGYDKAPYLMMILSGLLIAIGLNNVLGIQYLIPTDQEKTFTITVIVGAVVNFTLNLILIPFIYSYGAAISTVTAEVLIFLLQFIVLRKQLDYKKAFKGFWKYLLAGSLMFAPCWFMAINLTSSVLNTFLIVIVGVAVYFVSLIILKEHLIWSAINKILRRVKHGR